MLSQILFHEIHMKGLLLRHVREINGKSAGSDRGEERYSEFHLLMMEITLV